ncbi:unnamed protein product [Rotaria sp. Silwood1]|nr:unnamed protein product [Rotaria sp. Silwood1]
MASKPSRAIFTTSKSDELDVLERVMQFDPKRRPNASKTLQLIYFNNPPAPCPSDQISNDLGQDFDVSLDQSLVLAILSVIKAEECG